MLSVAKYHERYGAGEQVFRTPAPLVVKFAGARGVALDLACGPGRNALYLAELGWRVTAVDGSPVAMDILQARAAERGFEIEARVADLERGEFEIQPSAYDLICDCYFLHRDLVPESQAGCRPSVFVV